MYLLPNPHGVEDELWSDGQASVLLDLRGVLGPWVGEEL